MDVVELTRALVEIESPTFSEGRVVEYLHGLLHKAGYEVIRQPVTDGRDNLYAFREPPVVVLSTHVDCVPPFVPWRNENGMLHGRGVCDANGLAAAMFVAAEQLAAEGERRVGLLFVVGEERGSDGARAVAALEPRGRFLVIGDPTEGLLCFAQKARCWCGSRCEASPPILLIPRTGARRCSSCSRC